MTGDANRLRVLVTNSASNLRQSAKAVDESERDRAARSLPLLERARAARLALKGLSKRHSALKRELDEATVVIKDLFEMFREYVQEFRGLSATLNNNGQQLAEAADFATVISQRLSSHAATPDGTQLIAPLANAYHKPATSAMYGTCWLHGHRT